MSEFETVREFEHEGWHIDIAIAQDIDYRPGYDDDIYPRFEEVSRWAEEDEDRDYDGRFLPKPIIVSDYRGDSWKVTPEEIDRLTVIGWGENPSKSVRARARKAIESDARAIVHEDLSWVVLRVTASRGHIEGTDYLGGIDYDTRTSETRRESEKYVEETLPNEGMIETAIEEAARGVVGNLAPLALSY